MFCLRLFPPRSLSCRSEHQDQPVPAVRQQLRRVRHLSGRLSHDHDQSSVLPRPAHPAETLPALWRQRESTRTGAVRQTCLVSVFRIRVDSFRQVFVWQGFGVSGRALSIAPSAGAPGKLQFKCLNALLQLDARLKRRKGVCCRLIGKRKKHVICR